MPDLDTLERGIDAEFPAPEPPPLPPEEPSAQAPEVGTRGDGGAGDPDADPIDELLESPGKIPQLTADEWADLVELAFGWTADARGPHWEISEKRAKRLGKLIKKSVDQVSTALDAQLPPWVQQLLLPLITLGILGLEIGKRVKIDRQLEAARQRAEAEKERDVA